MPANNRLLVWRRVRQGGAIAKLVRHCSRSFPGCNDGPDFLKAAGYSRSEFTEDRIFPTVS
jgi:hypothetical protein